MKKLILCGLAFFALSLVGCRGDKDNTEEEDCKQKSETHVWDNEKKECIPKPAESLGQAECVQDPTKKWDVDKCRDATQAECVLPTVTWDSTNKKCVLKQTEAKGQYTVTLIGNLASVTTASHIRVDVDSKTVSLIKNGDCVRLKESDFAKLRVSVYNPKLVKTLSCVNSSGVARSEDVSSQCEKGNYSVSLRGQDPKLTPGSSPNANIDSCKELAESGAGS